MGEKVTQSRLINGKEGWMVRRLGAKLFQVFRYIDPLRDEQEVMPGFFNDPDGAREFAAALNRIRMEVQKVV